MGKCKKVLLVGATGMLGRAMKDALKERKFKILEPLQEKFDITDQELVLEYLPASGGRICVIDCARRNGH
ncbi:MAG: hypothetical protein U5N86_00960 [Planctomycetota bacterium]|nr:hypothetical protein [Planctomycetota bacterium]